MTTWDDVHAGDIVIGHDDLLYGVAGVDHSDPRGPQITLRRNGYFTTAQPPAGTPIEIWRSADMSAEAAAWQVLEDAGLGPQIIRETNG